MIDHNEIIKEMTDPKLLAGLIMGGIFGFIGAVLLGVIKGISKIIFICFERMWKKIEEKQFAKLLN
jgi:hypothetical protein